MRGEFVDVAGARLYYYAAGTRGAGEPLVLIHGCLTSSHLWSCVVPCLPAGHRVVIVDLLGHGRSDPPGGRPLTARAHADRLVSLLDALCIDRACLVGHGLGATIVRLVAPSRVSHLALLNTVASGQGLSAPLRGARYLPGPLLIHLVRSRIASGYTDAARANRSLDHYMRPFIAPGGHAVIAAQLSAVASDKSVVEATVDVPTAIIAGTNDPFVSVNEAKALHAAVPGSTLEVLPDSHYAPEESPERVAQVITQLLER
jgi:pimeloyl-ACP methyl ester carboxylesterase